MIKKLILLITVIGLVSALTGCGFIKPFNKPQYVTIQPSQTAFVIPLEGKTSDQAKLQSEEFLKNAQVSTKRIEIPKRWMKTGRMSGSGKWIPTVRVIVVDRFPETREWRNDEHGTSPKAKGFVGESKDSIKFSVGISATAQITEEDASKFLYQYSGKSLSKVMDFEIRNRIGTVLLEKYGSMGMTEIREHKAEVIQYVRDNVEPYFENRGITISNIGYVGDLLYVDKNVQDAINQAFNSKQEQEAQTIKNQTEIDKAIAEAKANNIRKQSMKEILEVKRIEIQSKIADGLSNGKIKLPDTLVINGNDSGQQMLFNIPIK